MRCELHGVEVVHSLANRGLQWPTDCPRRAQNVCAELLRRKNLLWGMMGSGHGSQLCQATTLLNQLDICEQCVVHKAGEDRRLG